MCGIAGYLLRGCTEGPNRPCLEALLEGVRPRGPDDEGICFIDRSGRRATHCRTGRTVPNIAARLPDYRAESGAVPHDAALLNTRFAIIDPSERGHQPFASADQSVIAVYHGEIYNHPELRSQLQKSGVVFRTACDTEVLVEGYRKWGDELWERLNGFWAVALFDGSDGSLVLSRDRFGVAPLYYREEAEGLFFASSIRPLLDAVPRGGAIETGVLQGFIDTELKDYDERTCYARVKSAPPATALRIPAGACTLQDAAATVFWTYPDRAASVQELPFDKAVRDFRDIFLDAVAIRLRSDVRLAFELSGGLDSSSIVAAAAAQGETVTTYTLKVPESDEEPYARTLLQRYKLDYRVVERPEADFLEDASEFIRIMEEPFHAPNVYTHYKLRQLMKQDGVHVVLAGSGGDEAFAGYQYDFWPQARADLMRQHQRMQAYSFDVASNLRSWRRSREAAWNTLKRIKRSVFNGGKPTVDRRPAVRNTAERFTRSYPGLDFHQQRLYHFQVGLLPYYLRSDDHFSMALPMEQRSPFLDYRIVDFGLRIPAAHLFRRGWTKYILRKAMEPFLPRAVIWRKEKMGFPFPLRPFLQQHRSAFVPLVDAVAQAGLSNERGSDYDALLQRQPHRLWRICSTGLWLTTETLLHSRGQPTERTP
jgi:asparagine synthase (glutamine-hydrolysing)